MQNYSIFEFAEMKIKQPIRIFVSLLKMLTLHSAEFTYNYWKMCALEFQEIYILIVHYWLGSIDAVLYNRAITQL